MVTSVINKAVYFFVFTWCFKSFRPTVYTEKSAESKTASVDSAIGSPGWQLDAEAPVTPVKAEPERFSITNNEDDTAPLLGSRLEKQQSLPKSDHQYYNYRKPDVLQGLLAKFRYI